MGSRLVWGLPIALLTACDGGTAASQRDAAVADVVVADVVVADVAADVAVDAAPVEPGCARAPIPAPGTHGPTFAGPSQAVEVLRDHTGIPHIYGRTDEDVYFASGYMQAVDRLFQMDLMRRIARGTSAEVIGASEVSRDKLLRTMGVAHWGRLSGERVAREAPQVHRLIDAWVAGVNRRVAEVRAGTVARPTGFRATELDFLPELWTVDDPYMVGRLLMFENANQLDYDILTTIMRRYVPQAGDLPLVRSLTNTFILPPDDRPAPRMAARRRVAPRGPRMPGDAAQRLARYFDTMAPLRRGASNNWAVAGRLTDNGRPLIAGDPHQGMQSPSVFWAQHMNSADGGGHVDVAGFAFAGAPAVHLGHNRRVAWTATTAYPDMMDVWSVATDGEAVTYGGTEHPVARCTERIAVKGAEAVEHVVEDVPGLGVLLPTDLVPLPIVSGRDRLLFRWTGFAPTAEASVFFDIDSAESVDAVDTAVRRMEIGAFNFIAADARDIVYRSHVSLPDRGDPATVTMPNQVLDGHDPRTAWSTTLLSDDRQPHSRGGARGFLFSANNDPLGFTANGRIDDDPYYYGVWFDVGPRAARIEQELTRLTAAGRVTAAQMQALQLDTHSVLADLLVPQLTDAWTRAQSDPALASLRNDPGVSALYAELTGWDRRMSRDASAATVFHAWSHLLAKAVLSDDLGLLFGQVLQREPQYVLKMLVFTLSRAFPQADRYMQEGRERLVLQSLATTRDWITSRFGSMDPARRTWGEFHQTRALPMYDGGSAFDVAPQATAGSVGTVNVSSAVFLDDGGNPRMRDESHGGPVYRMVAGFRDDGTPTATINFPQGNAGDPQSPHWHDTDADWVAGTYRPLRFTRAEVDADVAERITIPAAR